MQIDIKLHTNQATVWQDKSRFRVLPAGRRWGKTTLAIFELFENAITKPNQLVWYVAPTYRQAKAIAWRKLKDLVPNDIITQTHETELAIELINGSRIELKGCDKEDSLLGVGVHFVVIDEIGVIGNASILWQEVIRPMLVDTKGRALFIGTPRGQNFFYDIYTKGLAKEDGFSSHRYKTKDNPFIDREEIVQAQKETHPTYFAQEYEASFLADEEMTLITSMMLERLKGVQPAFFESKHCVVCDPSQGGDECVIYYMRNYKVIEEQVLHERDTMKIAGHIAVMAGRHKVKDVGGDCIGIGAGIFDRLQEMKFKVHRIHSAERALNTKRFYNVRAEMWWKAMEKIQDQKVPDIKCTKVRKQLNAVRYKVCDSNGRIQLEQKQKTKERISESPDRADTLVMGYYLLDKVKATKKEDVYRFEDEEEAYIFNPMTC